MAEKKEYKIIKKDNAKKRSGKIGIFEKSKEPKKIILKKDEELLGGSVKRKK